MPPRFVVFLVLMALAAGWGALGLATHGVAFAMTGSVAAGLWTVVSAIILLLALALVSAAVYAVEKARGRLRCTVRWIDVMEESE